MDPQAFDILEFNELLALLKREAQTDAGREHIAQLQPMDDLNQLQHALALVSEGTELRSRGVNWSFTELNDPKNSIAQLRIEGTALEPFAILAIARLCDAALAARAAILAERDRLPMLWSIVADLPKELNSLVARINNKILPDGELDDRASPELGRIRHDISALRSRITRSLESLMRRSEEAIQDELVTVRNDRFVIPVRADHRGRIHGVAHGASSSGATVFIEPLQTIEENNELQTLRSLEEQEVAKILWALSDELREQLTAIQLAADSVSALDVISAKARFADRFDCTVPSVTGSTAGSTRNNYRLELIAARHPLLQENLRSSGAIPVPVSLCLDSDHNAMVISGANAGGKTVALKTTGLLALMALSGLPVPAKEAHFPFYTSILADIGDHQSLAANLSTFTSHVANIARMMELCQPPALVLLDEVGTGTDPEEGSALGVAVVDHFRRVCGAQVAASTHYSGLKMYAGNEAGVLNASVEFDEKTLQPTYRLIVGVAGASSGLEIARRFGIPDPVIKAASSQVGESSRNASEYLRQIKHDAEQAAAERTALVEERAAVAEKYASLDKEANRRERERQLNFEKLLDQTVRGFEQRARELVSKIENRAERLKVEREAQKQVAELKRDARRVAATMNEPARTAAAVVDGRAVRVVRDGKVISEKSVDAMRGEESVSEETEYRVTPSERIHTPRVGDRVRLTTFGKIGIVDRIKDDEAEVRVGALRLREKLEKLEVVEVVAPKPAAGRFAKLRATTGTEVKRSATAEASCSELNVIGQTTDEAVDVVDKFLDKAFLNNVSEVRIVHGHGTGALRRAIGELLAGHPHVAKSRTAPPDQGGTGATLVELRQ